VAEDPSREGGDRGGDLGEREIGLRHERRHADEAVDHALIARERHRHAGLGETRGVGLALGEQRIVLGRLDEGGRDAGEVGRAQRRGLGLRAVGASQVLLPVPLHLRPCEVEAGREPQVRLAVQIGVRDGVHEHLQRELEPAVARAQRDRRRQVAPCAVAGDRDPARIATELERLLHHPLRGSPGVLDRGRERRLGGQPIVDRHDDAGCPVRERAAHGVVRVERADDPAPAVEPDHHGQELGAQRPVHAHPQLAGRAGDEEIDDLVDLVGQAPDLRHLELGAGAQDVERQLPGRGPRAGSIDVRLEVLVQVGHGPSFCRNAVGENGRLVQHHQGQP
jgi:hypothetical protein